MVSFLLSTLEIHGRPWTTTLLSWIHITIVAIDSGQKNITGTKQWCDMRLKLWLNWVSVIFTWGQFWPLGIVVACICMCAHTCVYVHQPKACLHHNSSPLKAGITNPKAKAHLDNSMVWTVLQFQPFSHILIYRQPRVFRHVTSLLVFVNATWVKARDGFK